MNQHKKTPFLSLQAIIITLLFMVPTTIAIQPSSQTTAIITHTISIDQPQLTSKIINNQPYTHVTLDDGYSIFQPGQPDLPAHGLTLLLPPNHQVSNIEITCDEPISLGVNHQITSVPEPIPLLDTHFQTPEQATPIFSTDKLYFPDSSYEIIGTYHFRGYTLLVLNLYPVTYHIITGELTYTPKICLTIHTQETTKTHPFYRGLSRDYTAVNNKISNPIQLNTYPSPSIHPQGILDYDLLIITTREFKPAFEVLKTAHEQRGRSVRIKTLNEIGLIPENVTPEDIREFITDEYLNYNIDYVLIGGDADIIPAQTLFVSAWTGGTSTYMPSDLYYACLDGTYNYDDDNKNGEPTDGPNGGDVDLVAEIYVGRASVGSIDEADNFISKTITYMETGGYDSGTVLLVGEHLWEGPDTWGGDYMDELIDHVNANAMITEGIPSTTYTINRLYDKTWNGNDWPTSEIMDRLTNGVHIVNHLGHSSYGYNMKMVNSQVSTLSNTNLFFLYSQGCMAGGFDDPDGYDSIAEYFTIKTPNAAFAAIMNARYGWGVIGSTDGASQRFHRQFWDAIYGE
ncbi:MAG: hypothetical protein KKC68_00620, partial [Candidatus Thermoplasmatota archaeon]|nr:hypothetical protein [Candidatus Thermoplasmatota archaeon]